MSAAGKTRGRPKLRPGNAKGAIFSIRLSPDERAAVTNAAARAGQKDSDWARSVILAAARTIAE